MARTAGRACKVITTCFIGREVRERTTDTGVPRGPYEHAQNFPDPAAVLELVALIVDLEREVDAGHPTDTVLVNNDTGWRPGRLFLDAMDGRSTRGGRLVVLHRENTGRSYGGYNHAFERLRGAYDHFLFTEDDILVNGDRYMARAIDAFEAEPGIGAVGIQPVSFLGLDGVGPEFEHIHGGVLLSSAAVLGRLFDRLGRLPHCARSDPQDAMSIIRRGEIAFSHELVAMGLRLVNAPDRLYRYAYDHMRGVVLP